MIKNLLTILKNFFEKALTLYVYTNYYINSYFRTKSYFRKISPLKWYFFKFIQFFFYYFISILFYRLIFIPFKCESIEAFKFHVFLSVIFILIQKLGKRFIVLYIYLYEFSSSLNNKLNLKEISELKLTLLEKKLNDFNISLQSFKKLQIIE